MLQISIQCIMLSKISPSQGVSQALLPHFINGILLDYFCKWIHSPEITWHSNVQKQYKS